MALLTSAPNLINNPQLIASTPTTEPKPGWFRTGMTAKREPDNYGDALRFSHDSGTTPNYYGPVESGTTWNNANGAVGQFVTITATIRMAWGDSGGAARLKLQAGGTVLNQSEEITGTDWTEVVLVGQIPAGHATSQLLWVLEYLNPSMNDDIIVKTGSVGLYVTDTDPTVGTGGPPPDDPPTAPANVTVGDETPSTLTVSWDAATDDNIVVGYNVYEGATKINPVLVTALSFMVTGLTPETSHTYTVKAVDSAGQESAASSSASGETIAVPIINEPPGPVSDLIVADASHNSLTLTWDEGTDDVVVTGYNVWRGTTKLTTTPVVTTSYVATGLSPETTYTFPVRSVDVGALESTAVTVTGTTTEAPPVVVSDDPWDGYATLADELDVRVAAFVGRDGDAEAIAAAAEYVPVVATYVHGYTRGRGWSPAGVPAGPLKAVIVAAAARLLANPEQVAVYTLGDYSERPAVLSGWTLPERAVLHRYRRTAA